MGDSEAARLEARPTRIYEAPQHEIRKRDHAVVAQRGDRFGEEERAVWAQQAPRSPFFG